MRSGITYYEEYVEKVSYGHVRMQSMGSIWNGPLKRKKQEMQKTSLYCSFYGKSLCVYVYILYIYICVCLTYSAILPALSYFNICMGGTWSSSPQMSPFLLLLHPLHHLLTWNGCVTFSWLLTPHLFVQTTPSDPPHTKSLPLTSFDGNQLCFVCRWPKRKVGPWLTYCHVSCKTCTAVSSRSTHACASRSIPPVPWGHLAHDSAHVWVIVFAPAFSLSHFPLFFPLLLFTRWKYEFQMWALKESSSHYIWAQTCP